ncbi:MAG TPA: hypothetical protein VGJ47_05450 [Gemmatimonadaceae bacterium]|jgi:hypothetical protein
MELRYWLTRGTLVGLVVLGIGGRLLMRVVAHMEHRPFFVFTPGGTLTVVLAGAVAGLLAGFIYYLVRRFIREPWLRIVVFVVICELVAWRGVHGLLRVPQLMFMGLALIYLVIIDTMGRRMHS